MTTSATTQKITGRTYSLAEIVVPLDADSNATLSARRRRAALTE
jgi:hypothetical protein